MSRAQWRARPGLGAAAMGTAALVSIAAATLALAPPRFASAAAPDCTATAGSRLRAITSQPPAASARVRITERLESGGQYAGRQLEVTPLRSETASIALPVESSISVPDDNVVVYTRVSRGRSEVRAIDLIDGCDMLLAEPPGITRSAILDRAGGAVYVHSVSGSSRSDTGVVRYDLEGSGQATVVPPLPDDARYGRTFGTLLAWSVDDATLAVQSCGMEACRTRLLDVATGSIQTIDQRPHGTLIGVTANELIAYDACHWEPCAVLAIDRFTGATETLADEAWGAVMGSTNPGATTVSMTTAAGTLEVMR